jgi:cell wall-associated NlpC family hydrolase
MTRLTLSRGALVLTVGGFLAAAMPSAAPAAGVYFVKEGDTLSKISRVFGVDVTDIRATNGLTDDDIAPGDRLRIPDAAPEPLRPAAVAAGRDGADRVQQAICRDETVYHTVARGDTLFAIGRRYGTGVDELLQLNGFRKRTRLSIGQRVVVRRSAPHSHTVTRGDTLARIAKRYGVPAAQITRLNSLDGATLVAGQTLQIEPCDPYAAAGSAPPPLTQDGASDQARDLVAALSVVDPAAPAQSAAAPSLSARVIQFARSMLGIPYRFGGSTLRGIDCSAYVQRVFSLLDVSLPRTAREQFGVGARIGRDELAVGDLVFFRTYASFPSHVGIYVGDNLFIHASSVVRKVTIDSIDLPYYRKRFLGARRLVAGDTPALAASTP